MKQGRHPRYEVIAEKGSEHEYIEANFEIRGHVRGSSFSSVVALRNAGLHSQCGLKRVVHQFSLMGNERGVSQFIVWIEANFTVRKKVKEKIRDGPGVQLA